MNVVFFLLGDSTASEFYVPTFRNTLFVPSLWVVFTWPTKMTHKIQTPGNHAKERIRLSQYDEHLKSRGMLSSLYWFNFNTFPFYEAGPKMLTTFQVRVLFVVGEIREGLLTLMLKMKMSYFRSMFWNSTNCLFSGPWTYRSWFIPCYSMANQLSNYNLDVLYQTLTVNKQFSCWRRLQHLNSIVLIQVVRRDLPKV